MEDTQEAAPEQAQEDQAQQLPPAFDDKAHEPEPVEAAEDAAPAPEAAPAEQAEDLEQQVMQLMERASRGWGKPLRIDRSKLATTTE